MEVPDALEAPPQDERAQGQVTTVGWIGVDLDGTLAHYEGWNGGEIGAPIPLMVERVKAWLAEGKSVRIVTARVSHDAAPQDRAEQREKIMQWCELHLGKRLTVTCEKDFGMLELWDDRCVQVIPNTGIPIGDQRRVK